LIGVCCFAYRSQDASFGYMKIALSGLAALLFLALIPIAFKRLRLPQKDTVPQLAVYPHSQKWFILIFNQALILLGGGLFFFGVILHSHVSPKTDSLSFDAFIPLLTQEAACVVFLPWMIISALSVLASHRAEKTGGMVWLPGVTVGSAPQQPKKFCLSAYNDILNMVVTMTALLLLCVTIGLLFESFSKLNIIASAWETPFRNALFMFILLMFSYRARDRLLKKYVRRNFSLGAILFIEAFLIVMALLGFEAILNFSEFPIQERSLFQKSAVPVDNALATGYLGTALMLWPLFLIPYLVPLFARIGLGLRAWQAFLMPLVIPGILFLWLLPQHLQETEFLAFIETLKEPLPLLYLGLSGLFIVYFLFQHVHSFFDLHVGSMPLVDPPYKNLGLFLIARPVIKGVLNCMALFFISGWFIVHMIFYGVGLFFMLCLTVSAVGFCINNSRLKRLMPFKHA